MDNLKNYSETAYYGKAGLTGISGAATTYSTGATTRSFAIAGKAYEKAQVSGGTTPTTEAKTGAAITLTSANTARLITWSFDSSGNPKLHAGDIVSMDSSGNLLKAAPLPTDIDLDTYCPFAYVLLKAGSTFSGTFTVGSRNWNTTGMTYTVVDVSTLPSRPVTA